MSKNKILFQLSGSIACFKACQLLSRLVQAGYDVEVVATPSALKFVGTATLEGLTGKRVHTDVFSDGSHMQHIYLMRRADLILLCPATANTLNKMASGLADDLIGTLFLAHDFKKPYLAAPAMNVSMLHHPATQDSIAKLRGWGIQVLDSAHGTLACGESGEGRLLEPEAIFNEIKKLLAPAPVLKTARPLDILITAGGTREPIDGVRSIANASSGRTGNTMASLFASRGHNVTLLKARDSVSLEDTKNLRQRGFTTFSDLHEALIEELGRKKYDAVIHAAAVSDFSIDRIESSGKILSPDRKIESDSAPVLYLKRNPKIVDALRTYSRNPDIRVIAFKLTRGASKDTSDEAVRKLARHAKPDLILHNDLSEIDVENGKHRMRIFSVLKSGEPLLVAESQTKTEAAETLELLLTQEAPIENGRHLWS